MEALIWIAGLLAYILAGFCVGRSIYVYMWDRERKRASYITYMEKTDAEIAAVLCCFFWPFAWVLPLAKWVTSDTPEEKRERRLEAEKEALEQEMKELKEAVKEFDLPDDWFKGFLLDRPW